MRTLLLCSLSALLTASAAPRPAPQGDATAILSAARQALGGEAALNRVTSFSVAASVSLDSGRFTTSEAADISCVLPDKFVKVLRHTSNLGPLGYSDTVNRRGFNGDELIAELTVTGPIPAPRINGPATPAEMAADLERQLRAQRHAFVQIALPLFAASFPSYPLTFTPAGRATGPTGLADVLEAVGPDGFTWKVFFDASTHLPASMTWMGKPIVVTSRTSSTMVAMSSRGEVMSRPGADPGPILPADPAAGLPDVQWQLTFEDYKLEDGQVAASPDEVISGPEVRSRPYGQVQDQSEDQPEPVQAHEIGAAPREAGASIRANLDTESAGLM